MEIIPPLFSKIKFVFHTWVSSVIVGLAAVWVIRCQVRPTNSAFQHIEARDTRAVRDAPPAVHSSDARILAGETLLQPRKPFFCFHFYNTVAEKAVLRQQVKDIGYQQTKGAAGDDVGGIVGGNGALFFPDFCVMLFQNVGQRL